MPPTPPTASSSPARRILSGTDLKSKRAVTLGDTLDGEPGISQSGFTGGASRPIIRGQQDNLLNETGRNHQSFLKDVLPLPGRNVVGGIRLTF